MLECAIHPITYRGEGILATVVKLSRGVTPCKITADNAAIAILFIIVFAAIVIPLFFCGIYC